jgi:hypothetical protein
LGKAVIGILQHPEETANQYLYVSTATITQASILESLQAQSDRSWEVRNVETQQQIESGRQKLSQGELEGIYELVKASFWGTVGGIRSDYRMEEKFANSMLGIPHDVEGILDSVALRVLAK